MSLTPTEIEEIADKIHSGASSELAVRGILKDRHITSPFEVKEITEKVQEVLLQRSMRNFTKPTKRYFPAGTVCRRDLQITRGDRD